MAGSAFGAVLLALAAGTALAQAQGQEGKPIVEIRVQGNRVVPATRVLSFLQSRVNRPYSKRTLEDDLKRLNRSGLFYDVVAETQKAKDGLVLILKVVERPLVQEVRFEGNQAVSTDDLKAAAGVAVGSAQNVALNVQARRAIEDLYKERGYPFAEVKLATGQREADTTVAFRVVEGPRVRIGAVEVTGHAVFTDAELTKHIQTAPPILWLFGGAYNAQTIAADIDRLKRFYRQRGFLDAKVGRELTFTDDRKQVTVTYVIAEGQPYTVADVTFAGAKAFTPEQMLDGLELLPGMGLRFDQDTMERDRQLLTDRYGERGYVDAKVRADHRFTAERHQVSIRYSVTEGRPVKVRQVIIRGNKVTQDRVVRRNILVEPGQVFDTVKMRQSRRRLVDTNLFKPYRVVPTDERTPRAKRPARADDEDEAGYREPMPKLSIVGDAPDERDLLVEVEEQETGMIIFGAGVSSDSGVIGTVSFSQRNFDIGKPPRTWDDFWSGEAWRGAGQQFSLVIEPGTDESQFSVNFVEPYLFDRDVSLGVSARYYERDRDEWEERRVGLRVRMGKRLAEHWYGSIGVRPQLVRVGDTDQTTSPEDALDADGDNAILSFPATITYDVRDSRRFPTEGHMVEFTAEPYVGDWNFLSLVARASKYWLIKQRPDGSEQHVLNVRGRLGYMAGDTPIFERFYAGGATTFRGFDYREMGPHEKGEPIGGDFMLLGTAEYNYPIVDRQFRGVLFLDLGTVEEEFEVTDFRASVGFGFRLQLDVFGGLPMAFDFGFPINEGPDDDTQVFHFYVGATF